MRLMQFLALAAVFSATYPLFAPWVPWLAEFLSIWAAIRSTYSALDRC